MSTLASSRADWSIDVVFVLTYRHGATNLNPERYKLLAHRDTELEVPGMSGPTNRDALKVINIATALAIW